jgi:hypothetical protein
MFFNGPRCQGQAISSIALGIRRESLVRYFRTVGARNAPPHRIEKCPGDAQTLRTTLLSERSFDGSRNLGRVGSDRRFEAFHRLAIAVE